MYTVCLIGWYEYIIWPDLSILLRIKSPEMDSRWPQLTFIPIKRPVWWSEHCEILVEDRKKELCSCLHVYCTRWQKLTRVKFPEIFTKFLPRSYRISAPAVQWLLYPSSQGPTAKIAYLPMGFIPNLTSCNSLVSDAVRDCCKWNLRASSIDGNRDI